MKRCTKCGELKPITAFHKRAEAIDGRQYRCKSCKAAWSRTNNARPEIVARNRTRYYASNESPQEIGRRHDYYLRTKEDALAKGAARYKANPKKARARAAARYAADPASAKAESKQRSARNVAELRPTYIKSRFYIRNGLAPSAVPRPLLEAKREQLLLFRLLQELKNVIRSSQSKD